MSLDMVEAYELIHRTVISVNYGIPKGLKIFVKTKMNESKRTEAFTRYDNTGC